MSTSSSCRLISQRIQQNIVNSVSRVYSTGLSLSHDLSAQSVLNHPSDHQSRLNSVNNINNDNQIFQRSFASSKSSSHKIRVITESELPSPTDATEYQGQVYNIGPQCNEVFIALGSNLGDKAENLREAVMRLNELPSTKVISTSPMYASQPYYVTDQPVFVNAAVHISTSLPPGDLIRGLKHIEDTMGRVKTMRNGPRLIDLDLVVYGSVLLNSVTFSSDVNSKTYELSVPHISMTERMFVLQPLGALIELSKSSLNHNYYDVTFNNHINTHQQPQQQPYGTCFTDSEWIDPRSQRTYEELMLDCPASPLVTLTPIPTPLTYVPTREEYMLLAKAQQPIDFSVTKPALSTYPSPLHPSNAYLSVEKGRDLQKLCLSFFQDNPKCWSDTYLDVRINTEALITNVFPQHSFGSILKSLKESLSDSEERKNLIETLQTSVNTTVLDGSRTLVMSIVNATPDSFSDTGVKTESISDSLCVFVDHQYIDVNTCTPVPPSLLQQYTDITALIPLPMTFLGLPKTVQIGVVRIMKQVFEGSDIIDIGGMSTRPGCDIISTQEEASRVNDVIYAARLMIDAWETLVWRNNRINVVISSHLENNDVDIDANTIAPLVYADVDMQGMWRQAIERYQGRIVEVLQIDTQLLRQSITWDAKHSCYAIPNRRTKTQSALQEYMTYIGTIKETDNHSHRKNSADVMLISSHPLHTRTAPVFISIDTFRAEVAWRAVHHGAHIVNDVSGGMQDPLMHTTVGALGCSYIAMHMRGQPGNMMSAETMASYEKPVLENQISSFNSSAITQSSVLKHVAADSLTLVKRVAAHMPIWTVIYDPGLGFSKTQSANEFLALNSSAVLPISLPLPILLGPSRKKFVQNLLNQQGRTNRLATHPDLKSRLSFLSQQSGAFTSKFDIDPLAIGNLMYTHPHALNEVAMTETSLRDAATMTLLQTALIRPSSHNRNGDGVHRGSGTFSHVSIIRVHNTADARTLVDISDKLNKAL